MYLCVCVCVCVANWENRNEFSVTSVSVSQTIKADRREGCGTVRYDMVWYGTATGHALYMPCTFHPLLPLGIRTGILSD